MEDMDVVEHQLKKLKNLALDDQSAHILHLLELMEYAKATIGIDAYVKSFGQMVIYEDPEVIGLRVELKVLEEKIKELSDQKIELAGRINEFKNIYYSKLGSILEEILHLRKIILEKYIIDNLDENKSQKQEYEDAKMDYEEFFRYQEESIKDTKNDLTKEDQETLKSLYRKCAKLCHPDVIDDSFKDDATEMFRALDNAYDQNDLERIAEIYKKLENGKMFSASSDTERNKEKIKSKIIDLKNKASKLAFEITAIKEDETYIEMIGIKNWSRYFAKKKKELEKVLMELQVLAETVK